MMRTALSMPFIDRSSDLQASLRSYQPMLPNSRMVSQCMGSALVPAYFAAGQFRTFTGFPIKAAGAVDNGWRLARRLYKAQFCCLTSIAVWQ